MTMKNEEDAMRRDLRRTFLMPAMLALLAFVAAPLFGATALAADATLYELTENMHLDNLSKPTLRTASDRVRFRSMRCCRSPSGSEALEAAHTGHDNNQGGRRLWIRSDARY